MEVEDVLDWLEDRMTDEEREEFSEAFHEQMEAHEEVILRVTAEEINIIGYGGPAGRISCK